MDSRAVTTLFSTYWSSEGWRPVSERSVNSEEFAHACECGVMFGPVSFDHTAIVAAVLTARDQVELRAVADAFVASLGTRDLHRRSALGSFAVLSHFPEHSWSGELAACVVCGGYCREARAEDLNILNFERLKWGGVRHLQPLYAAFDLQQFQRLDHDVPRPEHVALLEDLLEAIDAAPAQTQSAGLHKLLPRSIKANQAERDVLIGILGLCGVLETPEHRGFRTVFVPAGERQLPDRRFVDMAYPACWWTGADGVNWEAVDQWFGHLRRAGSNQAFEQTRRSCAQDRSVGSRSSTPRR